MLAHFDFSHFRALKKSISRSSAILGSRTAVRRSEKNDSPFLCRNKRLRLHASSPADLGLGPVVEPPISVSIPRTIFAVGIFHLSTAVRLLGRPSFRDASPLARSPSRLVRASGNTPGRCPFEAREHTSSASRERVSRPRPLSRPPRKDAGALFATTPGAIARGAPARKATVSARRGAARTVQAAAPRLRPRSRPRRLISRRTSRRRTPPSSRRSPIPSPRCTPSAFTSPSRYSLCGRQAHPPLPVHRRVRAYGRLHGDHHAHRVRAGDDSHHVPDPRRPALHGQRRLPPRQAPEPQGVRRGDGHPRGRRAFVARVRAHRPRDAQRGARGRTLRVIVDVGKCVGSEGLVGGQVVDIMSEGADADEVTLDTLKYIHAHKTGALLEVSVTAGAILAGADEDVERLGKYAQLIGLAFQVVDGILDCGGGEELGKPPARTRRSARRRTPRSSAWRSPARSRTTSSRRRRSCSASTTRRRRRPSWPRRLHWQPQN